MRRSHRFLIRAFVPLAFAAMASAAAAAELVVNGGFEANGGVGTSAFTGWTVFDQAGSSGSIYVQTGTVSPVTANPVAAPPSGSFAAMSAQGGPGSHVLYQDITIPAGSTASFSAKVYLQSVGALSSPGTLDFSVSPNQQARVDIMDPAASLQDVGAGVLLNVFQTVSGGAQTQPYTTITANLTPFAGRTIRLRFAETDNQGFSYFGVDDVSVQTASVPLAAASIPTLSEWGMVGMSGLLGLLGLGWVRRRQS